MKNARIIWAPANKGRELETFFKKPKHQVWTNKIISLEEFSHVDTMFQCARTMMTLTDHAPMGRRTSKAKNLDHVGQCLRSKEESCWEN